MSELLSQFRLVGEQLFLEPDGEINPKLKGSNSLLDFLHGGGLLLLIQSQQFNLLDKLLSALTPTQKDQLLHTQTPSATLSAALFSLPDTQYISYHSKLTILRCLNHISFIKQPAALNMLLAERRLPTQLLVTLLNSQQIPPLFVLQCYLWNLRSAKSLLDAYDPQLGKLVKELLEADPILSSKQVTFLLAGLSDPSHPFFLKEPSEFLQILTKFMCNCISVKLSPNVEIRLTKKQIPDTWDLRDIFISLELISAYFKTNKPNATAFVQPRSQLLIAYLLAIYISDMENDLKLAARVFETFFNLTSTTLPKYYVNHLVRLSPFLNKESVAYSWLSSQA